MVVLSSIVDVNCTEGKKKQMKAKLKLTMETLLWKIQSEESEPHALVSYTLLLTSSSSFLSYLYHSSL